ncbi:hypothetical protein TNCT_709961 [Trichonephila clavata]|uniref:Uncharacterized protein n=1 Tax=Trichonephila clavata TaxID=2740835 RepID=A0A8X6HKI3_TRICU|nr:hypothetical protein TNCT_709961 [Trichonephila clavata]
MSSTSKELVRIFQPKFYGPYEVMWVEKNSLVIWKEDRPLTVNIDIVRIYHQRDRDEGDVETDRSSDVESQEAQGESDVI